MRVWRIVKRERSAGAYGGAGSELAPGRWHSPPRRIVYAASSPELAILEKLVWIRRLERLVPFVLVPADVPDDSVLPPPELPEDWDAVPNTRSSRAVGDTWLDQGRMLAMKVPSAVSPGYNLLINPLHPDHRLLVVGDMVPLPGALTTTTGRT